MDLKSFFITMDYKKVWNIVKDCTVFVSALGLFLNYVIVPRCRHKNKQKEISILFINTLESQLIFLESIYDKICSIESNENSKKNDLTIEEISSYCSQLKSLNLFEKGLESIGIYEQQEIDILSKYYSSLKESIVAIETFILNQNNFSYLKTTNTITMLLGNDCILQLKTKCQFSDIKISLKSLIEKFCSQIKNLNLCEYRIIDKVIENFKYIEQLHKQKLWFKSLNKNELTVYIKKVVINRDLVSELSKLIAYIFVSKNNNHELISEEYVKATVLENNLNKEKEADFKKHIEGINRIFVHSQFYEKRDQINMLLQKNINLSILSIGNNDESLKENFTSKVVDFIKSNLNSVPEFDTDRIFTLEDEEKLCSLIDEISSEKEIIKFHFFVNNRLLHNITRDLPDAHPTDRARASENLVRQSELPSRYY